MPEQIPATTNTACYGFNTRDYRVPLNYALTEVKREAQKTRKAEARRAWRKANPSYDSDYSREHHKKNPEIARNVTAKKRGMTGQLSIGIISKLLESQKWTCIVCNKDLRLGYHVDHIVSVSKGGENVDSNIQILCPTCNIQKGNKDFVEFSQTKKTRCYGHRT